MEIQIVKNSTNRGNEVMLVLPQALSGATFQAWKNKPENKAKLEQIKTRVGETGKSEVLELN